MAGSLIEHLMESSNAGVKAAQANARLFGEDDRTPDVKAADDAKAQAEADRRMMEAIGKLARELEAIWSDSPLAGTFQADFEALERENDEQEAAR